MNIDNQKSFCLQADLKVLLAKPTCFLVLGKPGSGKTSVARKLANFWKCQLITPSDCLEQAIQQNTTLGNKASVPFPLLPYFPSYLVFIPTFEFKRSG